MYYSIKKANSRRIDESMTVIDLFSVESQPFDCVVCDLNGFHGKFINHKSDKYYMILEGTAVVKVEDEKYFVEKGDFIHIPKEHCHSIEGNVKFACISSPIYDWTTEDVID